mgnify:CR=1 FL=1
MTAFTCPLHYHYISVELQPAGHRDQHQDAGAPGLRQDRQEKHLILRPRKIIFFIPVIHEKLYRS